MSRNKEQLIEASNQVTNETQQGANTAERIGGILHDIAEHIGEGGDTVNITPTYSGDNSVKIAEFSINGRNGELLAPNGGDTVNITPTYSGDNSVKIAEFSINGRNGELLAPNGGGGTSGEQKTYFLNIAHGSVPPLPEISDYNSNDNTFSKGGYTWTSININPEENEDTYQMWAWFQGVIPMSTSGPVRIYNSEESGSNGEDGNEIEFIYRVVPVKPTAKVLQDWTADLAAAKGNALDKNGHPYTDSDAVPVNWSDRANGIDPYNKYEYRSYRESSLDANGKRIWGVTGFSEPVLISNWGEKGEDGDGVEYIFYADHDGVINGAINHPENWNENTSGKEGKTFQDNEFIADGSSWMDEPINLEESEFGPGSVEFVSIRKKIDGVWQQFSEPVFWTRYAKDGVVDGYTVDIVNENMPVGTDSNGSASGYTNRGWVQAYHNGTPLIYADSVDSTHFTYSIDTANISRSDGGSVSGISVTKNDNDKSQIDIAISNIYNFSLVNAYIPIIVTLPNNTTRRMEITLYGIEAGEAGTNIDLYISTPVIHTDAEQTQGSVYPSEIVIGVKIGKGENNIHTYISGDTIESAESKGYYFGYSYDNGAMTPFVGGLIPNAQHNVLTIEMRKGTSFATGQFIDSENILYVKDGAAGIGIQNIISYYRAVASESQKPLGNNDISLLDETDVDLTGWGENKPYLYRRDYTLYTNNQHSWGGTQLDRVWTNGQDGYALIIDPSYAIFDEPLIRNEDSSGNITYSAGVINFNIWSSAIQIVKGKEPQVIGYNNLSFDIGVAAITPSADNKTLTVKVTSVVNNAIEGKISFWVTLNGNSFFQVKIPVYINRIGSRTQYIMGDAENTIMRKTVFTDINGTVYKFDNIGNYLRSSSENTSILTKKVNDGKNVLPLTKDWCSVPADGSTSSPGRKDTIVYGDRFSIEDKSGDNNMYSPPVLLQPNTDYCFSAYFDFDPRDWLVGFLVISNSYSDGWEAYNSGPAQVSPTSTAGWIVSGSRYAFTFKTGDTAEMFIIKLFYTGGTNKLYRPQLELGKVPTQFEASSYELSSEIKQTADNIQLNIYDELKNKTGIDITNGTVDLIANKTTFSYYDNGVKKSDKVSIDSATGTLRAVDGDFSGTVRANILYHSLTEKVIGPSAGDAVLSDDCGDIVVIKINWTTTSSYGNVTLPNPASAEGRLLHVYIGTNKQSTAGGAYANILPPSGTIFNYTKGYAVTQIKLIVGDSADFYSDGSTWYLLTAHMRKTDA